MLNNEIIILKCNHNFHTNKIEAMKKENARLDQVSKDNQDQFKTLEKQHKNLVFENSRSKQIMNELEDEINSLTNQIISLNTEISEIR